MGGVFRALYRCVTEGCRVVYFRRDEPTGGQKCPGCSKMGTPVQPPEPR